MECDLRPAKFAKWQQKSQTIHPQALDYSPSLFIHLALRNPKPLDCWRSSNPVDSKIPNFRWIFTISNLCEHESILWQRKLASLVKILRSSTRSWKKYMPQYWEHTESRNFANMFLVFPYYISLLLGQLVPVRQHIKLQSSVWEIIFPLFKMYRI